MAPSILLVRFSAIGDILLTTPLVRALRARHPSAAITYVTRAAYAPLLARNPHLTEVIAWEPGTPIGRLARELRARPFTHRLDLHGSMRSRWLRWRMGGRWTGYPKLRLARTALIRWKRDWYRDRRPVAERYFDAARGLDVEPDGGPPECFVSAAAVREADDFLRERGIGTARQLIALAPGAAHATKRWPVHHWASLARHLVSSGNDLVVVGGPDDLLLGAQVAGAVGERAANAAGAFDLLGTAAILKRSRALIGGDTGVMHLATAVGTPVVALFGPTVERFGFFPYGAKATVVEKELPCRPCSAHGGPVCPLRHHRCLQDLMPDEVLEALRKLPR
ncbi:MAG: lipopolysaccharide heptosyltransferase II [Gemmatimonadales bacterium]